MWIRLEKISSCYTVKPFTKEDIGDIYSLCTGNPVYYQYMKMEPSPESIREVLTQLPPGKSMKDKLFAGLYKEGELAAILDLIAGYPDEKTAYIGWFMLKKQLQGKGKGSAVIEELLACLQEEGFREVQLGYIKSNRESEAFWQKNKFLPTGKETDTGAYTVVSMKRKLC